VALKKLQIRKAMTQTYILVKQFWV